MSVDIGQNSRDPCNATRPAFEPRPRHGLTPFYLRALIPAIALFGTGCQDVAVTPVAVISVEVRPESTAIVIGETQQLNVILTGDAGSELKDREVAWSSEDRGIAEIDATGVVSATGIGTTRIMATAEGRTGEGTITVMPKPVASVTIEPDALTLPAGGVDTIRVVARAADDTELTDRGMTWSSSDESIVQVDGHGPSDREATVRAIDCPSDQVRCTVQIVASAENVADTLTVTVTKIAARITITAPRDTPYRLRRRATMQLTAKVEASDGTDLTEEFSITWSSSDEDVATVDQTGKVTAVGCPGVPLFCSAIVSATVDDAAEVNAEVEVEVFDIGAGRSVGSAVLTRGGRASVAW